jgi:cholesterol transport system auxiliary component
MKYLLIAITLVANGCNILPKAADVHDFGLTSQNTTAGQTRLTSSPPVNVEAPKWLNDNRIRYRLLYASPTQVRYYMHDKWLASPPELFAQLLNTSNLTVRNPLTVTLLTFEQQFTTPNQAHVSMRFTVSGGTESKNNTDKQNFSLTLPCPNPDAKGAVSAFSTITRMAVDKINSWISTQQPD